MLKVPYIDATCDILALIFSLDVCCQTICGEKWIKIIERIF